MKKLKNRWLCALLALGMLLNAVGCGAAKPEEKPQEAETAKQEAAEIDKEEQQTEEEQQPEEETSVAEEEPLWPGVICTSVGCQYSDSVNDEWHMVEAQQQSLLLDEESAKAYPNLAKTLEDLRDEHADVMETTMNSLMESFQEVVVDGGFGTDLSDRMTRTVERSDRDYFSFVEANESYYGGAHGGYMLTGMTFDVKTGERVILSDIVKDADEFKDVVAILLNDHFGDIFYDDVHKLIAEYELDGFTWSMDPFGITLYFNQYELAPYAAGMQIVDLTYDDYPDLLDGSYFEPQEQYVLELDAYEECTVDLNGDGVKETITVDRSADEYDYYTTEILLNNQMIKSDVEDYSAECYLVKCKDAAYLYVFHHMESDYSVLEVFDLATGTLVPWGDGNSNLFMPGTYVSREEDGRYYYETNSPVFVNPQQFYLSSRLDTLSTYNGMKKYHVGEQGLPVSEEEVYTVDAGFLLKAKADVPCKVMKEDGTVTDENGVIPAGTFFRIVKATENEVWGVQAIDYVPETEEYELNYFMVDADTTYQTDTLYYIQLERENGDTINGTDIWELLDGLMYAG